VLFLFLFGYFNGAQRVTFQMLMAKVIPLSRRATSNTRWSAAALFSPNASMSASDSQFGLC
jgi:hypothetical protein